MIHPDILPHLKAVGAHIEPHPEGQLVHVPGANYKYLFHPEGRIDALDENFRHVPHPGEEMWYDGNEHNAPYNIHTPESIARRVAHGSFNIHQKNHSLSVTQRLGESGQLHHTVSFYGWGPDGKDAYVTASSEPNSGLRQLDPTSHALAKTAIQTRDQTAVMPLTDHFADHHNVDHLLTPPEKYARVYGNAIRVKGK